MDIGDLTAEEACWESYYPELEVSESRISSNSGLLVPVKSLYVHTTLALTINGTCPFTPCLPLGRQFHAIVAPIHESVEYLIWVVLLKCEIEEIC